MTPAGARSAIFAQHPSSPLQPSPAPQVALARGARRLVAMGADDLDHNVDIRWSFPPSSTTRTHRLPAARDRRVDPAGLHRAAAALPAVDARGARLPLLLPKMLPPERARRARPARRRRDQQPRRARAALAEQLGVQPDQRERDRAEERYIRERASEKYLLQKR